MRSTWTPAGLSRLDGRRIVVTGATNGIGLETARTLAQAGAHVIMAVRNIDLGRIRADEIGGSTSVMELDVADLDSVRDCAAALDGDIDVLINNAGIMPTARGLTVDGFESTLGTNFLGPFALTNLLLPQITDRVVIIGSKAHMAGTFDLGDPHFERRKWTRKAAYAQSKLAGMLWALQLDSTLHKQDSRVGVMLAHPGWAASNITLTGIDDVDQRLRGLGSKIANDSSRGAWPTVYAAVEPIGTGSFVGPAGALGLRGGPTLVGRAPRACDFNTAGLVWEFAEKATGTTLPA
ncbi:SDR family NAD(P)-dependent oxidoreductase [Jongsikchunia kroppenstedtii]|uniref:SDR family NAD(P)-dependent oxidoreductase n=1 Tax=Jongsikchunia kroppenstedtii TaxID=1121721 RepID=UPI00036248C7|nr:SDR family NAD(P)-dependent oxidoreductase [Jongsikchunia kroppenstedtii]